MGSKSHNAKKPKLAGHHSDPSSPLPGSAPLLSPAGDGSNPEKHKLSFAQHQHELQAEQSASPLPLPEAPARHLKSDAQQHQQKSGSHR